MSLQDRLDWDARFRERSHSSAEPDPYLIQSQDYWELVPPHGRALDVASGAGRNSVWLAEKGWNVTACDISLEGIRLAQALATERGVRLDLCCMDLQGAPALRSQFDLVICFFYLDRKLFPWLKSFLKPGGLMVYKTYTVDQEHFSGGPKHTMYLLKHGELLQQFSDHRVLYYQEVIKGRGVAQIVAQKE